MQNSNAAAEPWYVTAFQGDYRQVYAHRGLPSVRREVGWLAEGPLAGLEGALLDLCCGFGRLGLALAERGFDVFGLDLSLDLLRSVRDLPGAARHLRGRLVRAGFARLP